MCAKAAQAKAFQHGRLGPQGREGRVGAAAFRHTADSEIIADLGINVLGMLAERQRRGGGFERRPAALERHVHAGVFDQLRLDTLAHFLLDAVIIRDAEHADIRHGLGNGWYHVAIGAGARDGPVHLQPDPGVRQVTGLQDLVGEFIQRIAPALRRRTGMRGATLDVEDDRRNARRGQR